MAEKLDFSNQEQKEETPDHLYKTLSIPDSDISIYKEISRINGKINQMNKIELQRQLKKFHLNCDGSGEVMKVRLKNYYTKLKLSELKNSPSKNKQLPFYVVIDFEATCEKVNPDGYKHEIIEFPAILISSETLKIVDEFHRYVKPVLNTKLSEFCQNLTGITQENVDSADIFPVVLGEFIDWLKKHRLVGRDHVHGCVICDGPWDMGRFLYGQCNLSNVHFPSFCKRWVNIKKVFSAFYKSKRMSLSEMLNEMGMQFEGRPHCGLHDARNIANIALRLLEDGAKMLANERLIKHSNKPLAMASIREDFSKISI